jgi:hypothetical protein
LFFEGETGAPRTGIVDAIIARVRSDDADAVDMKLVQLKAGAGGLTGTEISRLKRATDTLTTDWLLAAFDGDTLHLVPDIPKRGRRRA